MKLDQHHEDPRNVLNEGQGKPKPSMLLECGTESPRIRNRSQQRRTNLGKSGIGLGGFDAKNLRLRERLGGDRFKFKTMKRVQALDRFNEKGIIIPTPS